MATEDAPAVGTAPPSALATSHARGDLLLALTTLPVQDPAAYVQAMAMTIAQALDVDRADVLRVDAAHDVLLSLGASDTQSGAALVE